MLSAHSLSHGQSVFSHSRNCFCSCIFICRTSRAYFSFSIPRAPLLIKGFLQSKQICCCLFATGHNVGNFQGSYRLPCSRLCFGQSSAQNGFLNLPVFAPNQGVYFFVAQTLSGCHLLQNGVCFLVRAASIYDGRIPRCRHNLFHTLDHSTFSV